MEKTTMKNQVIILLVLAGFVFGSPLAITQAEDGWTSLFDGGSLDGWVQRNGTATFRVEDGCIVGKTSEGSPNSFLCTEKDYGDFELKFEVLVDDALNSGVQIRSASKPDFKNGRVHGPQVEIAVNGSAGYIYGEALDTGWLCENRTDPAAKAAFKKAQWNQFRVLAVGKSIKTWVNGVPVADLVDEKSNMLSGFIGLQVHGIKKGTGPYEVRWRNLTIKDLTQK
jgi:hypothetical protein